MNLKDPYLGQSVSSVVSEITLIRDVKFIKRWLSNTPKNPIKKMNVLINLTHILMIKQFSLIVVFVELTQLAYLAFININIVLNVQINIKKKL